MESGRHLTVRTIPIIRMDCPACITVLENEIKKLNGVKEVRGNNMTKTLRVAYDPELVELSQIEAAIERIGYQVAYKKYRDVVSRLKGLVRRKKPDDV
jgi:copper chaperone CopZ